jgi:hypothetical protein
MDRPNRFLASTSRIETTSPAHIATNDGSGSEYLLDLVGADA